MPDGDATLRRRFIGSLAFQVGADVVALALRLAQLSLVTHHLGQHRYGLFSQAVTTVVVLLPLFSLRLNTACARFFPQMIGDRSGIRIRFSTTLAMVAFVGVGWTFLSYPLRTGLAAVVFDDAHQDQLIPSLIALTAVQAVTNHVVDFFRCVDQTRASSALNVVRSALALSALYGGVLLDFGVLEMLGALLVSDGLFALATLTLVYWRAPHSHRASVAPSNFKPYFAYALPLVPYTLLVALNSAADRYFITHAFGVKEAGKYAFSYGLVSAAMLISNALAYVIYPQLSRLWASGDLENVKALLAQGQASFLYVAIPSACGVVFVYPELVRLLAGDGFVLDRSVPSVFALGFLCLGLYGIDVYLVDLAKGSGPILFILIGAAIVNFVLNATLVPRFELIGAAIATSVAYLVQWLMVQRMAVSTVGFRVPIQLRFLAVASAGSAVMVGAMSMLRREQGTSSLVVSIAVGGCAYLAATGLCFTRSARAKSWAAAVLGGRLPERHD